MFRCVQCGAINRVPSAGKQAGSAVCGRCKADLDTSGAPQEVDASGLERAVAASPVPVVVDFWAPWCQPCRMAEPIVQRVAESLAGNALVLKLNIDHAPGAATAHGVRGVPTLIVFVNGREVDRRSGVMPAEMLKDWIRVHAGSAGASAHSV